MVRSRTAFAVTIVASVLAASGPATASADAKSKRASANVKDSAGLVQAARRGRASKPKAKPKRQPKRQQKSRAPRGRR